MTKRRLQLAVLAVAGIPACTPTTEIGDSAVNEPSGLASTRDASCTPTTTAFEVCWTQDRVIKVSIRSDVPAAEASGIVEGMEEWNALLMEGGLAGVPRLSRTFGSDGDVVVAVQGASGEYCGTVIRTTRQVLQNGVSIPEPYDSMTLYASVTGKCAAENVATGTIRRAFMHEVSRPLGWLDPAEDLPVSGVSDRCMLHIDKFAQPRKFNENLCLHEVEGIFIFYEGATALPSGFWTRGILRSTDLSPRAALPLIVGEQRQFSAPTLWSGEPVSNDFSTGTTPSMLNWSVDNPSVLASLGLGSVRAERPGTT